MSGAQVADRAAVLAPALHGVPLLADADIGDGDPRHTVWTALAYERSGISGLLLAARLHARPPGTAMTGTAMTGTGPGGTGVAGVRVAGIGMVGTGVAGTTGTGLIDLGRATATIAALAAEVPGLALIARTDAYASHGLDATIERCRRYAAAGADAVCPVGVDDPRELSRLHAAVPGVPLVVDRSEAAAGRPARPDADLARAGVRLVLHPMAALLAAMRAASLTYRILADGGDPGEVDQLPWAAFTDLTAPAVTDPDARYPTGRIQT